MKINFLPDALNIFQVVPRDFSREEWKEKMAFKAFLLLGIALCLISYQTGFSIFLKTILIYATDGHMSLWSRFVNSSVGKILTSKPLASSYTEPFFTFKDISFIEIIFPCLLKSYYVVTKVKTYVGSRALFSFYFGMIAVYASHAREYYSMRDAALLIMNGVFVLRTLNTDEDKLSETVAAIALTCTCVLPIHLFLDFILVLCLSMEVVRSFYGDATKLKIFGACVITDYLIIQTMKFMEIRENPISANLRLFLYVVACLSLLSMPLSRGRPRDFKIFWPTLLVLIYIYV